MSALAGPIKGLTASAEPQQTLDSCQHRADLGHVAVNAAYRYALARYGPSSAAALTGLTARDVVRDAVEAIAHLCDRIGLDAEATFAAALREHAQTTLGSSSADLQFDRTPESRSILWTQLQPPARDATRAHALTVLTLLRQRPDGVTSTELRDLDIRNPSNVVMTLIRSGHPIRRIQITRGGQRGREALYRLDRDSA